MRSWLASVCIAAVLFAACSRSGNFVPGSGEQTSGRYAYSPSLSETVLYRFTCPNFNQTTPSPLTPDGNGNYFGTSRCGGNGNGIVYELSPNGNGGWTETTLHAFTGTDGSQPALTPLVIDKRGHVFGVTTSGGSNGWGVAFELSRMGSTWTERVLYTFGRTIALPFGSLIADARGDLYGIANLYHNGGGITEGVYELKRANGAWAEQTIYDVGKTTSSYVTGGIVMDSSGKLFGISDGSISPSIVFELVPNGNGGWNETTLYAFANLSDAPTGAPILDKAGNLYSTTDGGGSGHGTVYELVAQSSPPWKLKTLYAFKGGSDASSPYAGVTSDTAGNLYGDTQGGGAHNAGTIYELVRSGNSFSERVLWSFDKTDGHVPLAPVTLDAGGDIFGTTLEGGLRGCVGYQGCGLAFEIR